MEYRRFVAYIYEYVNGRKQKNAGFAKLESRNGLLRMQVSLQKIPREEEALSIYGFVREGGWLPGIFLGQCSVRAGSGTLRLSTPAAQVGGSRYSFEELSGLWAEGSNGQKYITVFDDEGVDTTKLMPEMPGEKETEAEPEVEAEAGVEERTEAAPEAEQPETEAEAGAWEKTEAVPEAEKREVEAETDIEEKTEEEPEVEKPETEVEADVEEKTGAALEAERTEAEAEADAWEKTEAALEAETMPEPEECQGESGLMATEVKAEPETEQARGELQESETGAEPVQAVSETREPEEVQAEPMEMNPRSAPEGVQAKTEPETISSDGRVRAQEAACMPCPCPYMRAVPTQLDRKWQFMRTRFPHFQPFSGSEVAACLQITPRELPCIFQGYSRRANNSFLMHGFTQYRHLLFGRLREGGYILGVPGIFESQEMMMANMFGFPEFREAEGNRCGRRFGYWCRRI